jgi:hypothetical protein
MHLKEQSWKEKLQQQLNNLHYQPVGKVRRSKLMMVMRGRPELRARCTDASPALRHDTEIKEI